MTTQIWAHRGASKAMPENTLQAFALAMEMHADGIELDVHLSKDGEVVVCHDATVNRTTNATGRIVDLTLSELKSLNFAHNHPTAHPEGIPTLREVYRQFGKLTTINVEIKSDSNPYPGIEQKCLDIAREENVSANIRYSSFNHYTLRTLHKLDPSARLGILYGEGLYKPWFYAKSIPVEALHLPWQALVTPDLMPNCRAESILVHPWTVDDENMIRTCLQMGVDAIITNVPDVALRIRGEVFA